MGVGVAALAATLLSVLNAVVGEDLGMPPVTAEATNGASAAGLPPLLEDVASSTGYRYGATDDEGGTLDTLKVIPRPGGGYLGVYHGFEGGTFVVKLATSSDLLFWHHEVDLAQQGAQPTIARLAGGRFLVVYEAEAGCSGRGSSKTNCLRFFAYPDLAPPVRRVEPVVPGAPHYLSLRGGNSQPLFGQALPRPRRLRDPCGVPLLQGL